MDVLADLLSRGRARGSVFAQTPISRRCGVQFGGQRRLAVHALVGGAAWFERDEATSVRLTAGEVIFVPAGTPYRVTGAPGDPVADHVPGRELRAPSAADAAHLMCGAYTMDAMLSEPLLGALPLLVPIHGDAAGGQLGMILAFLATELASPRPGTQTVLDRSLDLLLALSLRAWFASPGARVPGWYAALDDPVAGAAITAIHAEPAAPWTVASLASVTGMSRAAFAKRFSDIVGQPPMGYLSNWRMTIAAQAFTDDPSLTIATVAQQVGYANEYAFATAFRRHFGDSPGRWRRRAQPRPGRDTAGRTDLLPEPSAAP